MHLVLESLHSWSEGRGVQLTELGMRITYMARPQPTEENVPDCDFAVPFH